MIPGGGKLLSIHLLTARDQRTADSIELTTVKRHRKIIQNAGYDDSSVRNSTPLPTYNFSLV